MPTFDREPTSIHNINPLVVKEMTDSSIKSSFQVRSLGWALILQEGPVDEYRSRIDQIFSEPEGQFLLPNFVRSYISKSSSWEKTDMGICVVDELTDKLELQGKPIVKANAEAVLVAQAVNGNIFALELDEVEFEIIYSVIKNSVGTPQISIDQIPELIQIQAQNQAKADAIKLAIKDIYTQFLEKIENMSFPILGTNEIYNFPIAGPSITSIKRLCEEEDILRLPVPSADIKQYYQALHEVLSRGKLQNISQSKPGSVAKRLRDLEMFSEIGSIRGVYGGGKSESRSPKIITNWEDIPDDPKSETYVRHSTDLGSGVFSEGDKSLAVQVVLRDPKNDRNGYNLFLHFRQGEKTITIHRKMTDIFEIESDFCEIIESDEQCDYVFNGNEPLSMEDIRERYDNLFFDNIAPREKWFNPIFEHAMRNTKAVVGADGEKVFLKTIESLVSGINDNKDMSKIKGFIKSLGRS